MALRIYNTLTRKKEEFKPLQPGKVLMYVCGPTVYDSAHIGHAMSAVVFDVIRRYLEFQGLEVCYVMNFTDVDDKIIQRAKIKNKDPYQLAEQYIQEYVTHLKDLNVLPASCNPRATKEMDNIIAMVRRLIDKGFAYEVEGDVYFRVRADDDYGKLSGRRLDEMVSGARVEVDARKEFPMDFALWKAAKPGEPAWESPWGMGRPGWHIECSAMSLNHLGEQIDIHGGGNDLIFPHHENEIAQTESLTGKTFSQFWIHNGMLQLSGEKMSKSLGNLITIEEFLEKHHPDEFRLVVINSGYRSPLTFNEEVLSQVKGAYARLLRALRPVTDSAKEANPAEDERLVSQMEATRQGFLSSMDDDFNTPGALGHLFDLVRAINHARDSGGSLKTLDSAQKLLKELTSVLGLQLEPRGKAGSPAEPFVDLIIQIRKELRDRKLWDLADQVRDRLQSLGVLVEDGKEGSGWRWG